MKRADDRDDLEERVEEYLVQVVLDHWGSLPMVWSRYLGREAAQSLAPVWVMSKDIAGLTAVEAQRPVVADPSVAALCCAGALLTFRWQRLKEGGPTLLVRIKEGFACLIRAEDCTLQ